MSVSKTTKRESRHKRIRARVSGTPTRPRLAVFRSNTALYAQLIDDTKAHTIAAANTKQSKAKTQGERAKDAGMLIAKLAKDAGVTSAVFDRGGFLYAGAIKAIAEGAREGGLDF
jgi:large subunit ribosomal protein L18